MFDLLQFWTGPTAITLIIWFARMSVVHYCLVCANVSCSLFSGLRQCQLFFIVWFAKMLVFLWDWFHRMLFFTIWFAQMSVVLYHLSGLLEWQSVQAMCTVLVYYCMDLCVIVWLCCHFRHCVPVCVCVVILWFCWVVCACYANLVDVCKLVLYCELLASVCVCCHIVILFSCLCMLCQFSWPVHTSVVVLWS